MLGVISYSGMFDKNHRLYSTLEDQSPNTLEAQARGA